MNTLKHIAIGTLALGILWTPVVFADTISTSIQSLSPGNTVFAKNKVTFSIITTGFVAQSYKIADSFSGSSVSLNNIDGAGNFFWVPVVSDVGTHTLTIDSQDYNGDDASTVVTITIAPPPSISIQSLSSNAIIAGQSVTFHVSAVGFTNPSYIVGDVPGGSSIGNQDLDASGNFSWTPELSDNGKHTITVYATDSLGHSNQASVDVQVGAGPTLLVQPITPGTSVNAGVTVSFSVVALRFFPSAFSVSDSFPASTISNGNINSSGSFVWTPSGSDVGTHVLSFKGQVGAFGDSATTSQTLYVVAAGASTSSPPVVVSAVPASATSSNAIGALQSQLASLMAQIQTQSASGGTPAASGGDQAFTLYLKPGSQNDEVTHLQQVLAQLGYLTVPVSGYYGSKTEDAVIQFQAAHHLDQLGVVGPATRAALNALGGSGQTTANSGATTTTAPAGTFVFQHFMGYGDDDPDVLELQKFLSGLNFLTVAPTGFYGNATVSALEKFQSAHGLPAVGYADTATRVALNQ